jgi:hypothetical protein
VNQFPETALDGKIQRTQSANALMVDLYMSGALPNPKNFGRIDRKDIENNKEEIEIPPEGWVP